MTYTVRFGPWLITVRDGRVVRRTKRPILADGREWRRTPKGWVRE